MQEKEKLQCRNNLGPHKNCIALFWGIPLCNPALKVPPAASSQQSTIPLEGQSDCEAGYVHKRRRCIWNHVHVAGIACECGQSNQRSPYRHTFNLYSRIWAEQIRTEASAMAMGRGARRSKNYERPAVPRHGFVKARVTNLLIVLRRRWAGRWRIGARGGSWLLKVWCVWRWRWL